MKTMYINRKDETVRGTLIQEIEGGVILQLENGEGKRVTTSTLKRWWKKIEVEEQEEAPAQEENKPAKPKKERKERKKAEMTADAKALVEYAYKVVEEQGGEVWKPAKDIKMRAFKVDGHMFLKFNWSNKGITLHCRKAAVEKVGEPTHVYKHLFDYAYQFDKNNKTNRTKIEKLIVKSLKYQQDKKAKKGDK